MAQRARAGPRRPQYTPRIEPKSQPLHCLGTCYESGWFGGSTCGWSDESFVSLHEYHNVCQVSDRVLSPTLLFLIFGRRAILSSAIMWQQILYPPIFSRVLDVSLDFLFSWRSKNIAPTQVSNFRSWSFRSSNPYIVIPPRNSPLMPISTLSHPPNPSSTGSKSCATLAS